MAASKKSSGKKTSSSARGARSASKARTSRSAKAATETETDAPRALSSRAPRGADGRARKRPRKLGRLVLIGGNEERSAEGEVLRHFVRVAGGKRARILVIGAALDEPEQTLREYERVFRKLGAKEVRSEPFRSRDAGEDPTLLDALERATAVFLTGGDQLQFTSYVAGTEFGERVRLRLQHEALVVGGTSAGAAAVSSAMLIGESDKGTVKRDDVQVAPGLGYWRDSTVDTHFNQRGRVHRLMTLFSENPQVLGIGLDENTAVDLELGQGFDVVGQGAVMVFDGRVTYSNAAHVKGDEVISVFGSHLHVLARGDRFDLRRMKPMPRARRRGASGGR